MGLLNNEVQFKKPLTPEEMLEQGLVSQKGYDLLMAHRAKNKERYGDEFIATIE